MNKSTRGCGMSDKQYNNFCNSWEKNYPDGKKYPRQNFRYKFKIQNLEYLAWLIMTVSLNADKTLDTFSFIFIFAFTFIFEY